MIQKGSSALEYSRVVSKVKPSRGLLFGVLIMGALLAFEIFNYSTTDFALTDLLGNLRFMDYPLGYHPGDCLLCHRFCRHRPPVHPRARGR